MGMKKTIRFQNERKNKTNSNLNRSSEPNKKILPNHRSVRKRTKKMGSER